MQRYFISQYTDGPATNWNVIDRHTQEWVRRFSSQQEAIEFADKRNETAGGLIFKKPDSWTLLDDCRSLLEAIDHTVTIHGHMDRGTPLHERLQRTLSRIHDERQTTYSVTSKP